MRGAALAIAFLALACSQPVKPQPPPAVRIVATERGPTGGRLVVIDEAGERTAELVPAPAVIARDNSAVFSPDGAWVAFVSSRGRGDDMKHTSLWVIAAKLDVQPVRVTDDHGDDLDPAWTPDGRALVFASDRGGSIDLWRIAIADGHAAGKPEPLTHDPGVELAPSVAPDGRIAFQTIAKDAGGTVTSAIAILDGDGKERVLTSGPGDGTPSWSPDGKTLAFSAPIVRDDKSIDADILAVDASGGHRHTLVDMPGTDEAGPVWSHDGRWMFATSLARKAEGGKPLLSSIVYADLGAKPAAVKMLRDPSATVSRLGPALAPGPLDDRTLEAGPGYAETLQQILIHALVKQQDPEP
jgi:Tol biopolymer transport system component